MPRTRPRGVRVPLWGCRKVDTVQACHDLARNRGGDVREALAGGELLHPRHERQDHLVVHDQELLPNFRRSLKTERGQINPTCDDSFDLEDKFRSTRAAGVGGDALELDELAVVASDHDAPLDGGGEDVEQGDGDDGCGSHSAGDGVLSPTWRLNQTLASVLNSCLVAQMQNELAEGCNWNSDRPCNHFDCSCQDK